jgi:hypothetical protein
MTEANALVRTSARSEQARTYGARLALRDRARRLG